MPRIILWLRIWLFSVLTSVAFADDSPLSAFNAVYDLYKNDKLVGASFFQVKRQQNQLDMRMMSRPDGIYAALTDLQPVTETTLVRNKGDYRLSSVKKFANPDENPQEVVKFDWQQSLLTTSRKNRKYQLPLQEAVYDYLSIHWLAAQMLMAEASHYELLFYRKGKLVASTLSRKGRESLEVLGKNTETTVIEQDFEGSSRRLKYYYDVGNPWLPLRIERSRKGKKTTVLMLKSLNTVD